MSQVIDRIIKVGITDDQRLLRDGLISHLQPCKIFSVVWQARTGEETLQFCRKNPPHLLLLDICLPDVDGTAVIQQIRLEKLPVKILALSYVYGVEESARNSGADDFLRKNFEFSDNYLIDALFALAAKTSVAQPKTRDNPTEVEVDIKLKSNPLFILSARQKEVLHCLAEGLSLDDISEKLCMAVDTVRTNIKKIYEKLEIHSRAEAVALAYKYNMIAVPTQQLD